MRKDVVLGGMVALALTAGGAHAATYNIDPAHTYPHFAISHLGFSTTLGRFNSTKGKIEIDLDKKTGAVEVVIDAASVDTGFAKRDEHLRSPDFLNANEFPDIKYKSTKVTFTGDATATVEGELTMMGVTKPVTLNVTQFKCGEHPMNKKQVCGFDANAAIKRSDYGIKFGLPAIGDDMKLTFQIESVKE
jgi:polyisoprenoid-binding protein YceI